MTDIRDPQMDEKPPPYECSLCGVSTWSWNEAKKHVCVTVNKETRRQTEKFVGAPRTQARVLHGAMNPSAVHSLIELLEKARDGTAGEFKGSTVELLSELGRPVNIHVKRGAPGNQGPGEKPSFSVVLEISQEE